MNIKAIGSAATATPSAAHLRPQGPPPPPPKREGDTTEFSTQALTLQSGSTPDALKGVLSDLMGDKKNLVEDLKTLGEYFNSQPGGAQSLNAFMEANFSREDLETFRKAAEAAGIGPSRMVE